MWLVMPTALYHLKNQTGSIVLIIALSLSLILTMFFIFIDTGYLYSEKNIYQNAVEAAAMAGAASLCDDDPEAVAREIAVENGLPAGSITVQVGFYDQNDVYNDFPEYKDFVWEASDAYPEEEYNNAVMVVLQETEKTLMGGFAVEDEVTVGAAAVAYLKQYGLLSLGEDEDDGITFENYANDEPIITCGDIHANNDITFAAVPDIDAASVTVTAGGTISGYSGGTAGVDSISLKPVSAYIADLYTRADKIITEDDFPADTSEQYDENGNIYTRGLEYLPTFKPHMGDHGGMIYYFAGDVDVQLGNIDDEGDVNNFIFASETSVLWDPAGGVSIIWGGENEYQVTIIAGENIDFGGSKRSEGGFISNGVVFLAGGDIRWRNAFYSTSSYIRNLRMSAEGSIGIEGPYSIPFGIAYNLNFGPPCPPYDVRLGLLVTS
jgi:hypothetical protein